MRFYETFNSATGRGGTPILDVETADTFEPQAHGPAFLWPSGRGIVLRDGVTV
jgi:hypothetical protein